MYIYEYMYIYILYKYTCIYVYMYIYKNVPLEDLGRVFHLSCVEKNSSSLSNASFKDIFILF
jgi:hypothetical protein